jgi:hypothetical protein
MPGGIRELSRVHAVLTARRELVQRGVQEPCPCPHAGLAALVDPARFHPRRFKVKQALGHVDHPSVRKGELVVG